MSSSPTAKLLCVAPADVERAWPLAGPLIRRAIERTDLSDMHDVESALFTGAMLLWLAARDSKVDAIAVTQLVKVGQRKACIIVICSGRGREHWLHLIGGLEDYARAEGCWKTRIYGRPGWKRVLNQYRSKYVILDRAL